MVARESFDVVVVGAGLAGAASAFFLSRERGLRVLLLERERELAVHSSGRNAGLVRRASGDPQLDPLCDEGAAFLAAPPDDFPGSTHFRPTGSFLLVQAGTGPQWVRDGVELVDAARLRDAVPPFVLDVPADLLHTASDGTVESWAVLHGFVAGGRARGVELRLGAAVRRLVVERGRVAAVEVEAGGALATIACGAVVDAAGAWAASLGLAAGASDPQLTPTRRHLAVTATDRRVSRDWPWVWDSVRGFYFRPESGGLLVCACDEEPDAVGACVARPEMRAAIAEKVARCLPSFDDVGLAKLWAGHRTRRPDGRFRLGADERIGGLVWAAGLGGHGVTCAAAVGRRVASATLRAGTRAAGSN